MTAANNNSGAGVLDSSKMTAKAQPDNNDDDNAGHQMASLAANGAERPVNVDPHLVYFRRNDPECPFYFPMWKKWMIVLVLAAEIVWIAGLGSAWAPANADIAEQFGVTQVVARVPQAMYLIGFAFGPVALSPIAEDYGRYWTFSICLALTYIMQIPIALAPNFATLAVCRFIAGFIASPIFNSCCNIPDLWRTMDEGIPFFALNIWAFSAESIVIAPIWGAYINMRYGWRWLWGISAIVGAALTLLFMVAVPETRHTVLLERRAKKIRAETGDPDYYVMGAITERRSINEILKGTLYRPVFMLLTEPIVNLFAIWDGLNYGVIYLAIEAVPLIYHEHGFDDPEVEFLFFSIFIGYILGIALIPIQMKYRHWQQARSGGSGDLPPESKLTGWGYFAAVAFPISLFLFAWLSIPSIHWFASMIPLVLFGAASHVLFIMISDYTVQSYGHLASSAVTGQSFARELMSAGLIVAGQDFYETVGYPEATTILASFAALLGVLPFVFARAGPRIRQRSRYSLEIQQAAKADLEREKLEEACERSESNA